MPIATSFPRSSKLTNLVSFCSSVARASTTVLNSDPVREKEVSGSEPVDGNNYNRVIIIKLKLQVGIDTAYSIIGGGTGLCLHTFDANLANFHFSPYFSMKRQ